MGRWRVLRAGLLIVLGIAWPWLEREGFGFYFAASLPLTLLGWLFRR